MSGNHLMANEPDAAALINGINGMFTNLSQMVQASTHSTPQGYVKDTIEKLNIRKATTYATNVDPEAHCL